MGHFTQEAAENDYHVRRDPGAGKVLHVDRSFVTFALESAAAEARKLASTARAGIRITISMQTDGGDITLTMVNSGTVKVFSAGTGYDTLTFDAVNDAIDLVSIRGASGVYHWLECGLNGVALS